MLRSNLVNFLSKPVITGFTSAVALTIGINQFSNLLGVDFIQSTLFEFLIEIYTEPASIQDLIQTPILGSLFTLEK